MLIKNLMRVNSSQGYAMDMELNIFQMETGLKGIL